MPLAEPATAPLSLPPRHRSRRRAVSGAIALLALATLLAEAATDVLPDGPIVGIVTPVRLVLGIGLVAVVLARPAAAGSAPAPSPGQWALAASVVALLVTAAVATVAARTDWSAWRGVLTGAAACLLAAGVVRVVAGAGPSLGLLALGAVGTAAVIAVHQFAAGTTTGFCRGALDGTDDVCGPGAIVRAVGTFANPNLLAAFLVLLLPMAAAGSAVLADRPSRLVGTAVVATGYVAVALTGSRGGVIAAAAGVAAFVVLRRPTRRRVLVTVAVAVLGAGALVAVTRGRLGVRADVWRAAVRLVLAHPLGVGPGRAGPLLDAAIPGPEAFQHAHDLWLNWAVESGWPGLAAALAVTAAAARLVHVGARAGSLSAAALGAGLAGFAVVSVTDDPANALRIALALGLTLGVAADPHVAPAGRHRAGPTPTGPGPGPGPGPGGPGRTGPGPSGPAVGGPRPTGQGPDQPKPGQPETGRPVPSGMPPAGTAPLGPPSTGAGPSCPPATGSGAVRSPPTSSGAGPHGPGPARVPPQSPGPAPTGRGRAPDG